MNNDTTFDFEERTYVNPQVGLTESESFIDTLRDVQNRNTTQINRNTYNLGSQVPSNIGGLGGASRMWNAAYNTPQADVNIANLRATAQANALNQATQNLSDIYQNRYKQALRGYYSRAKNGNGTNNPSGGNDNDGDVAFESNDINVGVMQPGMSIPGYAYVQGPTGDNRWYKINSDGSINYNTYYTSKDIAALSVNNLPGASGASAVLTAPLTTSRTTTQNNNAIKNLDAWGRVLSVPAYAITGGFVAPGLNLLGGGIK